MGFVPTISADIRLHKWYYAGFNKECLCDLTMLKNPRFVMATIVMAFISVIAVTLPLSAAESQSYMGTTNDANSSAPAIPSGMLPTDDKIGPVGIVNELYDAHSTITGIMIDHANMNYSKAENFVFVMTVVDEDNEKLNIILDPVMLTLGLAYDEADVIELVKIDVHMIDVKYGIYTPDGHISPSSQSSIDLWISLYNARCDSPTASRLCEALYFNLGHSKPLCIGFQQQMAARRYGIYTGFRPRFRIISKTNTIARYTLNNNVF